MMWQRRNMPLPTRAYILARLSSTRMMVWHDFFELIARTQFWALFDSAIQRQKLFQAAFPVYARLLNQCRNTPSSNY